MNAKIITSITMVVILGAIVYLNDNKSYAATYARLTVQLTQDKNPFLTNQLYLNMINQTSGGAVEIVSNETGENVIQYYKYNPDRNSVTVSNSTMTADFAIQIPDPTDPNTVKINRINLPLIDVQYITKHDNTSIPFIEYSGYKNIPVTIGNTTYNGIWMFVNVPYDRELNVGSLELQLYQ